jgi:hypothetical protein
MYILSIVWSCPQTVYFRDTFKTIAEDNAVNLSMIQDGFHDKISNMKEYMQEQVSNIFQEINCLRTRPNNSQYIHAADVHRDEPSEIQVVPQPTPKQSSNHIPISFIFQLIPIIFKLTPDNFLSFHNI